MKKIKLQKLLMAYLSADIGAIRKEEFKSISDARVALELQEKMLTSLSDLLEAGNKISELQNNLIDKYNKLLNEELMSSEEIGKLADDHKRIGEEELELEVDDDVYEKLKLIIKDYGDKFKMSADLQEKIKIELDV